MFNYLNQLIYLKKNFFFIQNFLSLYNKPQYASFYEEMMSRKQQKEFEERETKKQEVELTVIIFFIYEYQLLDW